MCQDLCVKVQEKFEPGGISWSRAMDEVRIDRVRAKHADKYLLVIIRDWPNSDKYKGKPDLVASLESQVNIGTVLIII